MSKENKYSKSENRFEDKFENEDSFGIIDLDMTDTIPQIMGDYNEIGEVFEEEYLEEYTEEFEEIAASNSDEEEYLEFEYDNEDSEEFDEIQENADEKDNFENSNANTIGYDEENYEAAVFEGQITYEEELGIITEEEKIVVENKNNKEKNSKEKNRDEKNNAEKIRRNTNVKEKLITFVKSLSAGDWMVAGGGIAVFVVAVVLIATLLGGDKRDSGNVAINEDAAKELSMEQVGNDLATLGIAGESGLLAATDAILAAQIVQEEEEEEELVETEYIKVTFTSLEKDLKIKFINTGTDRLVTGIPFKVTLLSKKGNETVFQDEDTDGIIYETGVVAGDYTVSIADVEGYIFEEYEATINVKDKIVYKQIDVKQEIKKESEINVAQEDTAVNNVQAEEEATAYSKDTVEWVDSSKTAEDGSDGYKRIDKSSIVEPTYAFRNVVNVENELRASDGSYLLRQRKVSVLIKEPEESSQTSDSSEDSEKNKESEDTDSKVSENVEPSKSPEAGNSPEPSKSPEASNSPEPSKNPETGNSPEPSKSPEASNSPEPSKSPDAGNSPEPSKNPDTNTKEESRTVKISFGGDKKVAVSSGITLEPTAECDGNSLPTNSFTDWTSSDSKVASVDSSGKVTGKAEGDTTIRVKYSCTITEDGRTIKYTGEGTVKVTVTKADLTVKSLTLSKENTSLAVDKTETISATAVLSDESKITDAAKFAYESSNEDVAKVDGNGVIKAIKKGEAKITVTYTDVADNKKEAVINVKVVENAENDTDTKLVDKDGNQVYVRNSDGKYVEATYADYYKDQDFFIASESGFKYTGWQTINGNVYYFDKDGNKVKGEQIIQGVTYKFTDDGILKMDNNSTMGIDVSKWNGSIDWNAVKNSGVSFVIIRCGYRGSTSGALIEDSMFKSNISGARAAGLKVGIYFFTQAINEVEAVEEASMVLSLIRDYSISYPVFIDTEQSGGRGDRIDKATRTAVCVAFCETIKSGGYTPGVYASKSWYNDNLSYSAISGYRIWLAQYTSQPTFSNRYDIWQHSEKGSVSGIKGKTDLNISYLGY